MHDTCLPFTAASPFAPHIYRTGVFDGRVPDMEVLENIVRGRVAMNILGEKRN